MKRGRQSQSQSQGGTPAKKPRTLSSQVDNELSSQQYEKLMADCVRYILSRESQKMPFTDNDLKSVVSKNSVRNLKSKILTKSNAYLTDVFGFSVGELAKQKATGEFEDGPSNFFIIQNELPEEYRKQCGLLDLEVSVSSPALTLLTLIATCINIKGGKISETLLIKTLKEHLPLEGPYFGHWEKELLPTLIKARYLHKENVQSDGSQSEFQARVHYRLGGRFTAEASTNDISRFTIDVHGDTIDKIQEAELEEE